MLERSKSGDHFSIESKGWKGVRDALLSVGDELHNRVAHFTQGFSLGVVQRFEISVDILCGHGSNASP
jgi:hypothetical protein